MPVLPGRFSLISNKLLSVSSNTVVSKSKLNHSGLCYGNHDQFSVWFPIPAASRHGWLFPPHRVLAVLTGVNSRFGMVSLGWLIL